ncbi:MAG TPA: hypothetical protein VI968_04645 [archaeon]|nr:hypothetical protein [archaeon]
MATASLPELKERLVLPAVSSSYPTLGANYKQVGYEVNHASRLVRTGKHYYDSKSEIPEGFRMTTAGEELAIQLALEHSGNDPRKANIFDDLFARGSDKVYMWQWTETGLRVPKGMEASKYEIDAQGRKYWARIVLDGDKEVGEILVPEGGGRLVAEWDEVFGVPQTTIENIDFPHKPYTTHFWFNATPDLDSTSAHYDVAVGRGRGWPLDVDEGCLGVNAYHGRLYASSGDGFRLVRGSVPKIEKELVEKPVVESPVTELIQQLDSAQIEQAFLERVRNDYRSMPHPDFLKKYNL